jgi:hypothetical protein
VGGFTFLDSRYEANLLHRAAGMYEIRGNADNGIDLDRG